MCVCMCVYVCVCVCVCVCMATEDWISFRGRLYVFDDFVTAWKETVHYIYVYT